MTPRWKKAFDAFVFCRTTTQAVQKRKQISFFLFLIDPSPGSWECPYCVCMFGLRKSSSKDAKYAEQVDAVTRILLSHFRSYTEFLIFVGDTRVEWCDHIGILSELRTRFAELKVEKERNNVTISSFFNVGVKCLQQQVYLEKIMVCSFGSGLLWFYSSLFC